MRFLLDVNVLIALFDGKHVHHHLAADWLARNVEREGWASCPITQNGCIRIMSQPAYPNALPMAQVASLLAEACEHPLHQFWSDDFSLVEPGAVGWNYLLKSRHLTDAYLLALAVRHEGCFVTLDQNIPILSIPAAKAQHLMVLC